MRFLSAIVLLLWSACFFHCSAEQMGLLDCATCQPECVSQDCDADGCPDQDGDDSERPCGVCHFLVTGGAPIITPITTDCPSEKEHQSAFGDFFSLAAIAEWQRGPLVISSASPESSVTDAAPYVRLYEFLARRALPVRGPTA